MRCRSLLLVQLFAAAILVNFGALRVAAQVDPDPNSPTPILLSEVRSTRVLAVTESELTKTTDLAHIQSRAFEPNARVTLFVMNLKLMPDEGASAFRVYGTDALGHQYRFPVVNFASSPRRGVFAVTIQLTDEIGFWDQPSATGDLLLQLAWRGMGSNRVRLGLGLMGGGPADDDGSRPTPLGIELTKTGKDTPAENLPEYVDYRWSGDRTRFLEQASFGPTQALDLRVRRIGVRA